MDIRLNTSMKIDDTWLNVHTNDTRRFFVDLGGQAVSGESLPSLVEALQQKKHTVQHAFHKDYDQIADDGCLTIFHTDNPAPDYMKDYRIGAWTGQPSPPSPAANARRSICDDCVWRIIRDEEGVWQHWTFDPESKEVRQSS